MTTAAGARNGEPDPERAPTPRAGDDRAGGTSLLLELSPSTATTRLPGRTGARPRARPCEIVWFAGGTSGARFSRTGRWWRVEREQRAHGLPEAPVLLRSGTTADAVGLGPAPTALAAFRGRRSVLAATAGAEAAPLQLELLEGVLRDVEREQPVRRLLLRGPSRTVAAYALDLSAAGTASLATGSLAALALGEPATPPDPPAPDPAGTVDDALATVLGTLGAILLHWAPQAIAGEAAAVHAMRVAIRRARSAMLVFRAALGSHGLAAERDGLRALAASLGRARDWDVFLDDTACAIAGSLPDGTSIAGLLADARGARRAAYGALGDALRSAPVQDLLARLALQPLLRPWREPAGHAAPADADAAAQEAREAARAAMLAAPVGALAPRLIDKRYRRLLRGRAALDGLDADALHDVRKAAKKLRYALEFLRPAFPHGDAGRLIRRLGRAQDALGALNDGATGAALMRDLPGGGRRHGRETGIVIGWLAARAEARRQALEDSWSALRRQDRFWR